MWAEPQESGKVKFWERYTDYLTGKVKKVSVTMDKDTRQTRKTASKILDDKIEKKRKVIVKKDTTLKELIDAYRKDQKTSVKESTYRRNFHTCNTFLSMFGEDVIVEKLTAGHIRTVFNSTGKSPITLNEYRTRFISLIHWGHVNDMLSDISFIAKFQRFNDIPRKYRLEDKFLEIDELKALLDGMNVQRWILVTKFLALSGMRFGEAASLKKTDINYSERKINIDKTIDIIAREETDTPKTTQSNRELYMQDELYTVCKQIDEYMIRQRIMFGYKKNDLFFQDEDGGFIKYYNYNKYLKENALRILGREKVTTHIMRHTHTCILAEQGVPIETITRRLGHEDSKITKQVYLHITKSMKKKDNDAIASVKVF